jgi:hypothetical protein
LGQEILQIEGRVLQQFQRHGTSLVEHLNAPNITCEMLRVCVPTCTPSPTNSPLMVVSLFVGNGSGATLAVSSSRPASIMPPKYLSATSTADWKLTGTKNPLDALGYAPSGRPSVWMYGRKFYDGY